MDNNKGKDKHDETVEESFPASDPPSNTPVTGIGGDRRDRSRTPRNVEDPPVEPKDDRRPAY